MAQQTEKKTDSSNELRLVLLGERWAGKTAVKSTIFGGLDLKEGTNTVQCSRDQREVNGRLVTVVDTPGWRTVPLEFSPAWLAAEIGHGVSLCRPGPHAFLLVVRADLALPQSDRKTLQRYLRMFGEKVWRHTMLLFTRGDYLEDASIEQHIETGGKALRWLVEKCGNRYHVFDNKNKPSSQVAELLERIDDMVAKNDGEVFTS